MLADGPEGSLLKDEEQNIEASKEDQPSHLPISQPHFLPLDTGEREQGTASLFSGCVLSASSYYGVGEVVPWSSFMEVSSLS